MHLAALFIGLFLIFFLAYNCDKIASVCTIILLNIQNVSFLPMTTDKSKDHLNRCTVEGKFFSPLVRAFVIACSDFTFLVRVTNPSHLSKARGDYNEVVIEQYGISNPQDLKSSQGNYPSYHEHTLSPNHRDSASNRDIEMGKELRTGKNLPSDHIPTARGDS